jgi:hypothetical protein
VGGEVRRVFPRDQYFTANEFVVAVASIVVLSVLGVCSEANVGNEPIVGVLGLSYDPETSR